MLRKVTVMRYLKLIILLGFSCVLASCGFHLRHQPLALPVTQIAIEPNEPYNAFQRTLRRAIEATGTQIVDANQLPPLTLVIENNQFTKHDLAMATDAHVESSLIRYHVKFYLKDKHNKPLFGTRHIQVSREINHDLNTVLGKNIERETLNQHLRERATEQVLQQIIAAKNSTP